MGRYILAHDLGTSGDKASLYSEDGKLVASATYHYDTYYPKAGWAEQDPEAWWEAVCASTKIVLEKAKLTGKDVACVSFSGQMMGALPLDERGNPLRHSIIWADARAMEETGAVRDAVGDDTLYQITGTSIAPNYSLEKILWVKKHQREIYDAAAAFVNAKDFIVTRLTGRIATDFSDASSTNMLDIQKKEWSAEILKAAGVDPGKLPPLYPSTAVIGYVRSDVADRVGLSPKTAVVIGGGDGACATVGAGAIEEGDAYIYYGSSSWISVTVKKPLYDPDQRTFNFCHLDPDLYMAPGTMQSAGGSYEWLRDTVCLAEKHASEIVPGSTYELMSAEAASSEPGAKGLLFLPYLLGERCPYWNPNARGAFIGLSRAHTRADIIRSVLEGVVFNLCVILDLFRGQGVNIKELTAIGGGVQSDLLSQIMADIYEVNLKRPVVLEEATSFGAAVAGGVGIGIFGGFHEVKDMIAIRDTVTPDPKHTLAYKKLYPVFQDAYRSLVGVFDSLAKING